MLKFNRLAQITTDVTQIAAALEDSDLIELSDDKTKIRRSPEFPLPDKTNEFWLDIVQRSVYVVS
jgi:lupus La protein